MRKYSYKFACGKKSFMFVKHKIGFNSPPFTDNVFENLMKVIKKYGLTEEDINHIPYLEAKYFDEIVNGDYLFIIDIDVEMSKEDQQSWQNLLNEVSLEAERKYTIIYTEADMDLLRIKNSLVPFI